MPGEVRQFAAGERGYPPVYDRVGARESQHQPALHLLLPLRCWESRFGGHGIGGFGPVMGVQF